MSEEHSVLEDIPDRISPATASNMLLWVVVAMVVLLFGWAALTKIDRTVRGQGKVIPSSQLQTISNLEGGVVSQILVKVGQLVTAGEPIIRLDPTQSKGELGSGEASTDALTAKIARLRAEVMGQEPHYPVSTEESVQTQILIERALHASRMADLANLMASAQARLSQARHAIGEAEANYRSRVAQRDSRIEEARVLRPLVEHGVEPRMSLVQAESAAAAATSDAESASAAISRARSAVAEASASAAAVRQNWRATAADELATAQAELSARSQGLPALARKVDRTIIRAPVSGRVNRVLVSTPGSAITPGQPLAEVVPSNDSLLIEAAFKPADIAFVKLGQPARVAITAYDRSIYGLLDGKVEAISPDTVEKEKGGETFYIVRVRTTTNALRDNNGRLRQIGPGMVAEVDVLGEKRSVLDYILSPITQVREDAFGDK
ncbi:MAG TPA: HlyD family type I secretion periplasmic adaptor subunit [Sphingomonas sp.]|nr:HlyD family type I secretion periplasmic adaptor subunit [Sphingomonas sp.]